jgi:hypothetical protein
LIDADFNIELLCHGCHIAAGHLTEIEFCEAAGVEPKGKALKFKRFDFGRVG